MAGIVGSTPGMLAAFAVGEAAAAALDPAFEVPKQDAWSRNANKILEAGLLARLVAQGGVDLSDAESEALRDGYAADKLEALIYLEQTVPGFAEALNLWRRGLIEQDLITHVLVKAGLDQRYVPPLLSLKDAELVGLGDIGYGIVRGILPAPSWLPVAPPTEGTSVPRFPQVDIDPVELAAKIGFDEDMLRLITGRSGLSLAPNLSAQALFRGLINDQDFLLAIAEGDLRTEWAETLKEASRAILTAGEYAELELRGFLTADQRRTHTAKHGMSDADSDLLYDVLGRAPAVHTITLGLARGGEFNGPIDGIPEVYLSSMQRGNIRPEYYNLEYATRYTYPSGFQIRHEAPTDGYDFVHQLLIESGWKPELAAHYATKWTAAGTPGAIADPHVKKAQTQLWAAAHKSYLDGLTDDGEATTDLTAAGVLPASIPAVLALWQAERAIVRRALSPAQIKKAVGQPGLDRAWALARLQALGMSQDDATTFLAE